MASGLIGMRMVRYGQRNITKTASKIFDIGILQIKKVVVETLLKKPSDLGWSKTPTSGSIQRQSNKFKEIRPPFPVVKNPDNFFKTSRSLLSSFLDII